MIVCLFHRHHEALKGSIAGHNCNFLIVRRVLGVVVHTTKEGQSNACGKSNCGATSGCGFAYAMDAINSESAGEGK